MKLTTKGRFAVSAMVDLAQQQQQQEGPVPLATIAGRQEISLSYLEQLFAKLRRAGLVTAARGPGGGYRLARTMDEISIAEIVDAVDEGIDTTRCGGRENCRNEGICPTHHLWDNLNAEISRFLSRVSLGQVVRGEIAPVAREKGGGKPGPEWGTVRRRSAEATTS
ncbi:MAG: Rrf2 family transcriptional regulator [Hydrogenophilus sp.]|nr:Rrf2 family transcriptional regulator [Hydrogenophilus sp.]